MDPPADIFAIAKEVFESIAPLVSSPSLCRNGSARFILTLLSWSGLLVGYILAMEPFLGHAVPVVVIHLHCSMTYVKMLYLQESKEEVDTSLDGGIPQGRL